MKRIALLLLAAITLTVSAQSRFGTISYREVVTALPEYASVQAQLEELRARCEAEISLSEKEFTKRYSEFIDGQATFPDIIRAKRQKELQELMEKNIAFKKEADKTILDARRELMKPLRDKVTLAAKTVCLEEGYDYILNLDRDAYLYVNETRGTDITDKVKILLGIPLQPEP